MILVFNVNTVEPLPPISSSQGKRKNDQNSESSKQPIVND